MDDGACEFVTPWRDTILTVVLLAMVVAAVAAKDGPRGAVDVATVAAIFAIELWVVLSFGMGVFGRRNGGRSRFSLRGSLGLVLICALHWANWNDFWRISRFVLPAACVLLAIVLTLDRSSAPSR